MKRAIRYFLFTVVLVLAVIGLQYTADYAYKIRAKDKVSQVMLHKRDDEIMIFGSSVANQQFNAEFIQKTTGNTAYNLGIDGVFFTQYRCLIQEFLAYTKKCKAVVIACDYNLFRPSNKIDRDNFFAAYFSMPKVYNALCEMDAVTMQKCKFLPGYKFSIYDANFYRQIFFDCSFVNNKGYKRNGMIWKGGAVSSTESIFDAKLFTELDLLTHVVANKGIKVILVIPPIYDSGYISISNHGALKEKLRSLTNEQVFFLDYTEDSISHVKSLFKDNFHLNEIGVEVFMPHFIADFNRLTKN